MGLTNRQHALCKKYSALTGERDLLQERIERVRRDLDDLPKLEARAAFHRAADIDFDRRPFCRLEHGVSETACGPEAS